MNFMSANHLYGKHGDGLQHISTSCFAIDNLLDGGFPLGHVSQVAGESASGKTQLCFQLCINVQIPSSFGGMGANSIYVDTENTFISSRLLEMAESTVENLRKRATEVKGLPTPDTFLSTIYLFRCQEAVQLLSVAHQLFDFIKQHPTVKLIVVDSIAHCLRSEEDSKTRLRFLHNLAEIFRKLSRDFHLAVVIINQVSTKLSASFHGTSSVIPALGAIWSNVPSVKLMLTKQNGRRLAIVYKSLTHPRRVVDYDITKDGFRDAASGRSTSMIFSQATANDLLCNDFTQNSQTFKVRRSPEKSTEFEEKTKNKRTRSTESNHSDLSQSHPGDEGCCVEVDFFHEMPPSHHPESRDDGQSSPSSPILLSGSARKKRRFT
ncbi:unnamed protein product [Clavelina lepadiformis]|uniref:DNA repair protein RAD51 homolog 3 n=1 Tax=Clavelina lepadiformis TaxID=159417 RepID=A0ABP0FGI3_CLALP